MIPNHYHFVFGLREQTEPFHLMYYLCLQSCLTVNQPEVVYFHYHHEPWGPWWDRIKPKLTLRRIALASPVLAYDYADESIRPFRYAHLADFARLEILLEEGGIYADIDTLFLRPIPAAWHEQTFILGRERSVDPASGSLCNAWIASRKGASFCQRWLEAMPAAFDGSWSNHSTQLPWRLSRQFPREIAIAPEHAFYALDWTPDGIANLFTREVALPPEARSLHLWSHLWFAEDRRDFSNFHGGLLTPEYVLGAQTTYAREVRRFLTET